MNSCKMKIFVVPAAVKGFFLKSLRQSTWQVTLTIPAPALLMATEATGLHLVLIVFKHKGMLSL